jgi:ribosome-associated protein
MADLVVNDRLTIPEAELRFAFSRSPGPGGQNVNKVNSKATLRWSPATSTALPPAVLHRLLRLAATRISAAGELIISSHEHRDQKRNVEACRERLRQLVLLASVAPRKRIATRPTGGSVKRRLGDKKRLSARKQSRGGRHTSGDE